MFVSVLLFANFQCFIIIFYSSLMKIDIILPLELWMFKIGAVISVNHRQFCLQKINKIILA